MALTMEQLADKLLQLERRFDTVQQENENMRREIENLRKERDNWNNEEYADFMTICSMRIWKEQMSPGGMKNVTKMN
ncbi:unnamed protein product [Allacma fusca]|uniref:Uncharacterized protein n=1 Tax=Allacma fusca TaxID=39272 RepID=A0A8J2LIT4_9HEXA|nr:unnamed protein product [Allacma fusca]